MAILAGAIFPRTTQAAPDANLIGNGTFEAGNLAGWDVCGGVRLADASAGAGPLAVHGGRYALRIGSPSDDSCGDTLTPQLQASYEGIVVPADASNVTLSFWYSRTGPFGAGSNFWTLSVVLVTTDGGEQVRISDYIYPDVTGGWNLARWELSPDDAAKARGRTFGLYFAVQFSLSAQNELAYYIDDLEVLPNLVRTPLEAAPPVALADNNTQPLVGYSIVDGKAAIVRADFDGSNLRVIARARTGGNIAEARWSPNGQTISMREDTLKPEPNEQPSMNWAQISALSLMNADGSNAREVYRSPGKKLVPGSPAGCRPPRTGCIRYDDPASDNLIFQHHWSPDGSKLAVNECGWLRYADGAQEGEVCRINVVNANTGAVATTISYGEGGTWSSANRLLYRINLNPYGIAKGIYELDMSAPTANMTGTLIFDHKSPIDTQEDLEPRWSPDGKHFATARFVRGNHFDSNGTSQLNAAIMLFDRTQPATPNQLVLIDFGRYASWFTWSPDGKHLLYTLQRHDNAYETYWLDVATGKTGFLNGDLVFADWRPNPAQNPALTQHVHLPLVRR